jgi:hypothetical protein
MHLAVAARALDPTGYDDTQSALAKFAGAAYFHDEDCTLPPAHTARRHQPTEATNV